VPRARCRRAADRLQRRRGLESLAFAFDLAEGADLILTIGGASVGDHDLVGAAAGEKGLERSFWRVAMRPGKPLMAGRIGPVMMIGLPGNPVSAMVTFEEFVRPALRKLAGHPAWFRPRVEAVLGERLRKPAGRLHLVRVRLERRDARVVATPTGNQSSGVLRSMTLAQGLLVFPADATELPAGAAVQVQVLDADFLAASDAGL
jgi:molybdopterin molybdotransferase